MAGRVQQVVKMDNAKAQGTVVKTQCLVVVTALVTVILIQEQEFHALLAGAAHANSIKT